MSEPDPDLRELAELIRAALIVADQQMRFGVAALLDTALLQVIAMDSSGTIDPHPFEPIRLTDPPYDTEGGS